MKKLMLIINPKSGKNGIRNYLQDIISVFHSKGWMVTVFPTRKHGDAPKYIHDYYSEFDLTVCCGGDGTLNETVEGIMNQPLPPKLGYIPVGTANDLAATLNISKNPIEAAKSIIRGNIFLHDIGSLNDRYFTYVAAFGTFSNISYSTPQAMKRSMGKSAYIIQAALNVKDIKPHHAKIILDDEIIIEDNFSVGAVLNTQSFGGLFKLKDSEHQLNDGIFEVLLIKPPKNAIEVTHMLDQLVHQKHNTEFISLYHAKKIEITTDNNTAWCIDGEFGGEYQTACISVCDRQMAFFSN